jgi:hypothetical protein
VTDRHVPPEIERLVASRERARAAGDFATADELRRRIQEVGFAVADTLDGPRLTPVDQAASRGGAPAPDVPLGLDDPPTADATVQWLEGAWPNDVARGIASFDRHCQRWRLQHVVVRTGESGGRRWSAPVDVVPLPSDPGWSASRNAGLARSRGALVVVIDGSIEVTGDVVAPLRRALDDPSVGVTGPFGLISDDLRQFRDAPGPRADAVQAYLLAFRRELLQRGVRFDERFRFYRNADIEFSFQVRALGMSATVTTLPVVRHEHRVWTTVPEAERERLSKRNFYRFLERWRGRTDLTVRGGGD